jgi:hypothetical protein
MIPETELAKMSKYDLARMHRANGGLMTLAEYLQWTKDELVNAVMEDQQVRTPKEEGNQ